MEIFFILVEPSVPENIGAAARVLKTMGFSRLRLVNPPGYPHPKTFHVAHGSHDILSEARIFPTLQEALFDIDFAIASSAKRRSVRHDIHHAETLAGILADKGPGIRKAALVFGREESGLTNEEVCLCDLLTFIPMKRKYPSLNLSHAIMIYAYLLSPFSRSRKSAAKPVPRGKVRQLKTLSEQALDDTGFRKDSAVRSRIMERMALLGDDDVNLVLSFLDKFSKKRGSDRNHPQS